jgi:peroxiredoxin Q/BCP
VTSLRFGQVAPDFSLPSTAGSTVSLRDFRGQDVVLVFYCYDFGRI